MARNAARKATKPPVKSKTQGVTVKVAGNTDAKSITKEVQPGVWVCVDPRFIVPEKGDNKGKRVWASRFETAKKRLTMIDISSRVEH